MLYKIKCTGVVCGVPIGMQCTSVKQHLRDHNLFWYCSAAGLCLFLWRVPYLTKKQALREWDRRKTEFICRASERVHVWNGTYRTQPCRYRCRGNIRCSSINAQYNYVERIERMVPLRCCCSSITLYKKSPKRIQKKKCNLIIADTCIVQFYCSFMHR